MKLYKEGTTGGRSGAAATGGELRERAASLGVPVAYRMMENHRNRFIRFRLSLDMRLLLAFAIALIPMQAMSLKDFNAKPGHDQAVYVVNFIEKMTADLGAKNPQLAQDIREWYSRKTAGKPISDGMERLYVELGAVEIQAKDGRADLSKIQIESVIVYLTRQKFPPQVVTPITPARGK